MNHFRDYTDQEHCNNDRKENTDSLSDGYFQFYKTFRKGYDIDKENRT